jgi:hypothetical protein
MTNFCNEILIKNILNQIHVFESKNEYTLKLYNKCITKQLKNCHLLLEESRALQNLKIAFQNEYEKVIVKCEIEKKINEP